MISCLYYRHLLPEQRKASALTFGIFALFDVNLVLLSSGHEQISFALSIIAPLLVGIAMNRTSLPSLKLVPGVDLWIYLLLLIASTLPLLTYSPTNIPHGLIYRMDLELLTIVVFTLVLGLAFPALNDPNVISDIRSIAYFTAIPFGLERTLKSLAIILILGMVIAVHLFQSNGIPASAIDMLLFTLLLEPAFRWTYGYRSFIIAIFGTICCLVAILALLLHYPPFASFTQLHDFPIIFQIVASIWGGGVALTAGKIWGNTDTKMLVSGQKFAHSIFLGILATGTFLIYWVWMRELLPLPWFSH